MKAVSGQPGLRAEAMIYYAFVLKMSKREQEAADFMKAGTSLSQAPALNIYFLSNLLYLTGRNEEALTALAAFPKDKTEVPFRHINYLEGKEKMNRLDPDTYVPLMRYLQESKFKSNKRDVSLRLAYFYLMLNNRERFNYYSNMVDKMPKAKMDRDKEADIEKARGYEPHPSLLKARYLVAGGYYAKANAIMQSIAFNTLTLSAYQTEYYLLMGKIGLANRQFDQAIAFSNKAIAIGKERKEHYAADAALLAGMAAQQQNRINMALDYWQQALDIDGQDDIYIENIHKIARHKISLFKSTAAR
jgi:tetratricopeptide (TPR) repeat protein